MSWQQAFGGAGNDGTLACKNSRVSNRSQCFAQLRAMWFSVIASRRKLRRMKRTRLVEKQENGKGGSPINGQGGKPT
jgi:hypothetical protein